MFAALVKRYNMVNAWIVIIRNKRSIFSRMAIIPVTRTSTDITLAIVAFVQSLKRYVSVHYHMPHPFNALVLRPCVINSIGTFDRTIYLIAVKRHKIISTTRAWSK